MSAETDTAPDPALHARLQVGELVDLMEEIDWSHVDGMGVAEAAAIQQRFREAINR